MRISLKFVHLEGNQVSIDVLVSAVDLKHRRMLMKRDTGMHCTTACLDADTAACHTIYHHLSSATKENPEFSVTTKRTELIVRLQLIFLLKINEITQRNCVTIHL
jgi:hypothetical protein